MTDPTFVHLTVKMDPNFRDEFLQCCLAKQETASGVIRRMMRDYMEGRINYKTNLEVENHDH